MNRQNLSRGRLARTSGVNSETIRYYEKVGLIPPPPRSAGGHRVYGALHVKRLAFVKRCRELGFSLEEIRGLMDLVHGGQYTCHEVMERTESHLTDIRLKIQDLKKMERTLTDMVSRCSGDEVPECPIVDRLWDRQ